MNLEMEFERRGVFLYRDGLSGLKTTPISNKKLCFISTDRDVLMATLLELSKLHECRFVRLSSQSKDGMYLGRCFFINDEATGKYWAKYKTHPKLMCNLQDDDFVKPYRDLIGVIAYNEPLENTEISTPELVPQPTLTTERLILEPFKDTDVEDIFRYASRSEVSRFVPWETHKSIQDSLSFLNYIIKTTSHVKGKLFYIFAIRLKEAGRVIGSFDFKNANQRCGQIDYALGFEYWGQGLITEAAAAVRDWAFQNLPEMVRLQAFCVEENIGSSRVMEKIGMSREGVRRKAFILKENPVNLSDYALVR